MEITITHLLTTNDSISILYTLYNLLIEKRVTIAKLTTVWREIDLYIRAFPFKIPDFLRNLSWNCRVVEMEHYMSAEFRISLFSAPLLNGTFSFYLFFWVFVRYLMSNLNFALLPWEITVGYVDLGAWWWLLKHLGAHQLLLKHVGADRN